MIGKNYLFPLITSLMLLTCKEPPEPIETIVRYTMPEESAPHEGTWLQWPHEHQYGTTYRDRLEPTWIAMTDALHLGEKVHIIAYDNSARDRIINLLDTAGIALSNISFRIFPTDDVWVRDNGPIFVRDNTGQLVIEDWGFNGWGRKADYKNCDAIPEKIAAAANFTVVNLNSAMTNEGGSIEIDGYGTLMACKSSILNSNRNPGMSQETAEEYFKKYLGITNTIWLDGVAGLEITDMHIDGFARFGNAGTIVTMSADDLLEWEVPQSDIDKLYAARNNKGAPYAIQQIPLTQKNVITTYGKNLGYKGSYINYYIGNKVVLVPNYQDPNDSVANALIQSLYPTRTVIGIDVRDLYEQGGMVHCVTQQQPE